MKNTVIYYPYIRVPESPWLTRMLLYWDSVRIILPMEFDREREQLGPHTESMLDERLVEPIVPSEYVPRIRGFVDNFLTYLHGLGSEVEERQSKFAEAAQGSRSLIHSEKGDELIDALMDEGLAAYYEYPWCSVEASTAQDFMAYLAVVLGEDEYINAIPVTDERKGVAPFFRGISSEYELEHMAETKIGPIRLDMLESVFPAPEEPLSASDIRAFKDKHGYKLAAFRRKVEERVNAVAGIENAAVRDRQLDVVRQDIAADIEELQTLMTSWRWHLVKLGDICGVVAQLSSLNPLSLASTVLRAFRPKERPAPFAYAVYARKMLTA